MLGTWLNIATVLVGGTLGLIIGGRLPARIRETVMHGIGLITLLVGMQLALKTENVLIVMGSLLLGAILGEWWRIDVGLERFAEWLKQRSRRIFGDRGMATFAEGFITASLVFCVGPMTVLGALQDGLTGDISLLAIKSVLDGVAALAFASTLGVGVLFSILTILIYQGGLSLLAGSAQSLLSDVMVTEISAVGGVMLLALGLVLLQLTKIRVANFLPALAIAALLAAVF